MSSPSSDSLKVEIDQGRMKVGNQIQASTGSPTTASALPYIDSSSKLAATAVTASRPVYIDSSSVPQTGAIPFAYLLAPTSSATSLIDFSGRSNPGSADTLMQGQIVAGARVTTLTYTGFLQVNITDAAGNVTDGVHYIPFGTLT